MSPVSQSFRIWIYKTSSWQSEWFFKQLINFLKLIWAFKVRFDGNFSSSEKKAYWEACLSLHSAQNAQHQWKFLCCCTSWASPQHRESKGHVRLYSVMQMAFTSRSQRLTLVEFMLLKMHTKHCTCSQLSSQHRLNSELGFQAPLACTHQHNPSLAAGVRHPCCAVLSCSSAATGW